MVQKIGDRATGEGGAGVCASLTGVTTGGRLTDALHGVVICSPRVSMAIVVDINSVSC